MEKGNTGLILTAPKNVLTNIDLINNRPEAMLLFADMVKSGKMNIKTPTEALTMYIKSQELGLPFVTATDHMHVVKGKSGVDIHILRAQVLRAGGIVWENEFEHSPLYEYKDSTGLIICTSPDGLNLPDVYELPIGNTEEDLIKDFDRITSIGKTPVFKTISRVQIGELGTIPNTITSIRFERAIKLNDGTYKTIVERGTFTTFEMVQAGLHLDKQGNVAPTSPHLRYEPTMQNHRAWTFGARKVASDVLLGMYELKELYDLTNTEYKVDEQGEILNDQE